MVRPDGGGGSSMLIDGFLRHDVSPGTISAQADAVAAPAGDVENFNADLTTRHNTAREGVAGVIATAMEGADTPTKNQARSLVQGITVGAGAIRLFSTAVETFNSTIDGLNSQIRSEPTREEQIEKKSALSGQHAGAVETLQSAARTAKGQLSDPLDPAHVTALYAAGALPSFAPGMFSNVTDLTAVPLTALPVDLAAMTTREQADYIKLHAATLDAALIALFSPEVKELVAEDVAQAIKDKEIDRATVDALTYLKNDPAFAEKLYTTVSPNEMSEAIAHINWDLFGVGDDRDGDVFPGSAKDKLALYDDFMNAAGVTLATYSKTVSDPVELADDWFRAITDDDNPTNAAALTLLLREGGEAGGEYDPDFISKLTDQVLDWERDQDGAVWGPLAQANGQWIRDPDRVTINEWTLNNGYEDETQYSFSGGLATDGLANLLGAMGSSPEGAQKFFTDYPDDPDEPNRLEYLMLHRTFSDSVQSDEGDGLGEALQAATIGGADGKNGTWTSDRADALAEDLFTLIAKNSGTEDMDNLGTDKAGGKPDGDADGSWHVWRDMTDSLGAIGAGYGDDIYFAVSDRVEEDGATRLGLSEEQWKIVVGEIGHTEDKTGVETLLAGVANSGIRHEVGDLVSGWKGDRDDLSLFAFDRDPNAPTLDLPDVGGVLGELVDSSVAVQRDEEMTAEVRRAYVSKAFEFGTSFLPGAGSVLGETANEALKTTFDFAKGEAISRMQAAIDEAPPSSADQYVSDSRTNLNDSLRYALANEMLQQGLLGEQSNPERADGTYAGVPDTITQVVPGTDGKVRVFDPELFFNREPDAGWTDAQRAAWNSWQDSEPEAILSDLTQTLTSSFDTEMNKGG
ncbi:hypothetical protein FE697_018975 [Mumia zhuanghuii]|uniref:Uncharacterized protein n=2 Tax=Mumia TaxID=1546255 RepID=A0ABW1QJ45_9ACTN|nr:MULTISPECIES: hypothetical protein [Mumia]KAA1419976.1 hypothetical protein FE697_018975 [Mumia zhuanghuii]